MKSVSNSTLVTEDRDERREYSNDGTGESETKFVRVARRDVVEASILSARTAGDGGRGRLRAKENEVRGVRGASAVESAGWASESDLCTLLACYVWRNALVARTGTYGASVSSRAPLVCLRARCGLLFSSPPLINVEPVSRLTGDRMACRR